MDRAPVRLHPAALRRQPHHLGILGRFLLKEQGQRDGRGELWPTWCLHRLITVELNVRMTDAANWRQVGEVK